MTTNVGRVQASIVPDVSGFAAQADAALTPEMSNLGRKLGETLSRAMTRAIDFSGINTGLHRALRLAETQAAGSGREVGRGFARALRTELTTELQNMPEVNVKVSLTGPRSRSSGRRSPTSPGRCTSLSSSGSTWRPWPPTELRSPT